MDINLLNLINRVTTLENLLQRLLQYLNPTGGGNGDSNNFQGQIDALQDKIDGLKKNSTRVLEIVNDTISVNVDLSGNATVANNENSTLKLKIGSADATITDVKIASGTGNNLSYHSFPYSYFSLSSNKKTITTSIPASTYIGIGTKSFTIKATGTYNNISFSEERTLKVVGMTMGDPEANYDLKVSASTIKLDSLGNNSPSVIDAYILKFKKGIFTKMRTGSFDDSKFALQYKIDNGSFTTVPSFGITTAGTNSWIIIQALYGGAVFDEETVHVIKDGIDGDSTPCSFSIDNDTMSIDVDADGIVTEDNSSEEALVYMYYGTLLGTIDSITYASDNEVKTKPDFITIKTALLSTGESVAKIIIAPKKGDKSFINAYSNHTSIIYKFLVKGKLVTNERTINLSGVVGIKCIATQYGEYDLRVSTHSIKVGDKNDPELLKVWIAKNNKKIYPLPNDLSISYSFTDSSTNKLITLDSNGDGIIDTSTTLKPLNITLNSKKDGIIDSEYISVTKDKKQGLNGAIMRNRGIYDESVDDYVNLMNDSTEGLSIRYMDYVIYPKPTYDSGNQTNSSNYYLVNPEYGELGSNYQLKTGLTPSDNYISDTDFTNATSTVKASKAWIKASKMSFSYILNLIADYVDSKTVTVDELLVKGTTDSGDTNIVGGMINGGSASVNDTDSDKVIFFAGTNSTKGSINVREAPFYVTKEGLMKALKAYISGTVLAESFTAGLDNSRFLIKLGDDALQFFYNGTAYASLEYGEKTVNGTTATTVWLGIWVDGTGWKWIDLGNAMKTEGTSTTYTDVINLYRLSGGGSGVAATESLIDGIRLGSDGLYYSGSNTANLTLISGVTYYELLDSGASIVINSRQADSYFVISGGRIYNKVSFNKGVKTNSSTYVVTIPWGTVSGLHATDDANNSTLMFSDRRIFVKLLQVIDANNSFYMYSGQSGTYKGNKVTVNTPASGTYYCGTESNSLVEMNSTDLTKLIMNVSSSIESYGYDLAYLNTKKFSTSLNAKKLNFNFDD